MTFFIIPDTRTSKPLLVFAFILGRSRARWQTVRLFLTNSCISSSDFSLKKCELPGFGERGFTTRARRLHGSYRYWHAKYFLLIWLWNQPITQSCIVLVPPPNPAHSSGTGWSGRTKGSRKFFGLASVWMKRAQYWHSLWTGSTAQVILTADLLSCGVYGATQLRILISSFKYKYGDAY